MRIYRLNVRRLIRFSLFLASTCFVTTVVFVSFFSHHSHRENSPSDGAPVLEGPHWVSDDDKIDWHDEKLIRMESKKAGSYI